MMFLPADALKKGLVAGLASLLVLSNSAFARANDLGRVDEQADIVLNGVEYTGWDLATSGRVTVDGKLASASGRLKNGAVVLVDADSTARAEIRGIGRVSIAPKSELVLDVIDDTVVARMLRGNMRVEVAEKFGAYVETADSIVVAHPGSYVSFRVATGPLGTRLERDFGDVEMRAANDSDGWDIDALTDDDYKVKARKTQEVAVKVKRGDGPVSNQPVTFAITQALDGATGGFDEGVQRVTVTTDSDGVARADFKAGAGQGTVWIEASIPGTESSETLHVFVDAPEKTFWNKYTTSLYIAMGAGAVAGAVLAVKNAGDDGNGNQTPVVTVR